MPRGETQRITAFIHACYEILVQIQPASVRAVAYQLFIHKLLASMSKADTNKVSAHLVTARKDGRIPWEWIVDETREPDRPGTWADAETYLHWTMQLYKRDRWTTQPHRVEVWSEKNTVRGTLAPVLEQFGVLYRPMHGFTSWTCSHEAVEDWRRDPKPTTVLYVGDWDPSGAYMSEVDLPQSHLQGVAVDIRRLAIVAEEARRTSLPAFPASDKAHDTRYPWWQRRGYGDTCWELDAMNPVDLRTVVQAAIEAYIDWDAWLRADEVEAAEQRSMRAFLRAWQRRQTG